MDKETLSHYGWIVILVLILAVMLALASPFGSFIAGAIKSTTAGLFSVNQGTLGSAGIDVNDVVFNQCEHEYTTDVVVDCSTTGTINYTCDKCGDTYTEEREMPKHTFDNVDDMTCNKCNATFYSYSFTASGYDSRMKTTTATDSVVVIPETFEYDGGSYKMNYKVTSIGSNAFKECTNLTSVTIPDAVKSIGSMAFFGCTALTDVNMNDSCVLEIIDDHAFRECSALTTFDFPKNIKTIDWCSFFDCTALKSITIPASVTTLGEHAFEECISLETVNFEKNIGITKIGEETFYNCQSLKSITIPNGVISIEKMAFYKCASLKNVNLPSTLTTIRQSAFSNSGVEAILIPNTVTTLEAWAFRECTSLKSVRFEDNGQLETLVESVFWYGPVISELDFGKNNSFVTIENAFSQLQIEHLDLTVCENLTTIASYTFGGSKQLKTVIIPNHVSSIGMFCFSSCDSLETVIFEKDSQLTYLASAMFEDCVSLEHFVFPDNVETTGSGIFEGCSSLKTVCLPKTITEITNGDFRDTNNLTDVYYEGTEDEWTNVYISTWNDPFKKATKHYETLCPNCK